MTYLLERREEEKERRRLDIVEAAEQLYAAHGWDLLTMEKVARQARLSRALVYVYFKDKDDLLLAIAGRGMDLLAERFREAMSTAVSGFDKIEAMGRAYITFGTEFPHYFDAETRFQSSRKRGEDRPSEVACSVAADKVHGVMVETLLQGVADGSVRADIADAKVVSVLLWAFSHGLVQIVTAKATDLDDRGVSVEQVTEEAIRMIGSMITAGPKH